MSILFNVMISGLSVLFHTNLVRVQNKTDSEIFQISGDDCIYSYTVFREVEVIPTTLIRLLIH